MAILPVTFVLIAHFAVGYASEALTVSDGMAYVGGSHFQIVDIHDPSAPALKWSSKDGAFPMAISVVGRTAYVGGISRNDRRAGSLEIFDVQDVSAPKSLGVLPLPDQVQPEHLAVANDVAYIGYRCALLIVDVRDATAPQLLTVHGQLPGHENPDEGGSFIDGIAVDGSRVYLAQGGIRILDVSDLRSPKEVGFFRIRAAWASGISVHNGIAYVSAFYIIPGIDKCYSAELVVVDVTVSSKPVRLKKMKISKDSDDFAVSNGVVYASNHHNLYVHDLKDLGLPPMRTQSTLPSKTIEKDRLVTECEDGFKIFDISEPLSPRLVGTYQMKQ